jgi:tRNA (guanine9-N1)-methyltransferase
MAERAEESGSPPEAVPVLSKNALKRQLKRQRWEDSKADRRAYKKAKLKEKKEVMKQSGQRLPKRGRPVVEGQENSGIRVVIDCSFDDLMIDKVFASAGLVALTLGNL